MALFKGTLLSLERQSNGDLRIATVWDDGKIKVDRPIIATSLDDFKKQVASTRANLNKSMEFAASLSVGMNLDDLVPDDIKPTDKQIYFSELALYFRYLGNSAVVGDDLINDQLNKVKTLFKEEYYQ